MMGKTEPRIYTPPLRELTEETSLGYAAIEYAKTVLGKKLYPWQEWALIHLLEIIGDLETGWKFRFRTVLFLISRQNGKTVLSEVIASFFLNVLCVDSVFGTSLSLDKAEEVWEAVIQDQESVEELSSEIERISRTNGNKRLILTGLRKYKVGAPTRRAGRGDSNDLVMLDEIREHRDWETWSAAAASTNAKPNGMIVCFSNAGDPDSIVLRQLRDQAIANITGTTSSDFGGSVDGDTLGLFEWSSADGAKTDDMEELAQANPALEERASILQASVGGPWLTRNEARADNNLPPVEGGDELIIPLNVLTGGQASPQDTHMEPQEPMTTEPAEPSKMRGYFQKSEQIRIKARSSKEEDERMAEILQKFWKRQAGSVLPKIGAKSAKWWDEERWNDELTEDIEPVINSIADAHGKEIAAGIGFEYNTAQTRKYLHELSKGRAAAINMATYRKLQEAMEDDEEEVTPAHVFDVRESKDSLTFGRSLALAAAGWAAVHEAPHQAEQHGIQKTVEKMWVIGENPRQEHAMMNGQTVPIDEPFSNGCFWPGDENGDPDTTCGCNCSTEVIITVG